MEKVKNNLQLTSIATVSSFIFLLLNKNDLYRYILFVNLILYLSYYLYLYLKNKKNKDIENVEKGSIIYFLYAISIFSLILLGMYYLINLDPNNINRKSTVVTIGWLFCIIFSVTMGFMITKRITRENTKLRGIIPNYLLGVLISIIIAIPTIILFLIIANPLGLN